MSDSESDDGRGRGGEAESLIGRMEAAQIAKSGGGGGGSSKSSKTTKEEEEQWSKFKEHKASESYMYGGGGGGGGGSSASDFKELSREEKAGLTTAQLKAYMAAEKKHIEEANEQEDKKDFLRRLRVKEGPSKPYVEPPKPVKEPPAPKPRPAPTPLLSLSQWTKLLEERVAHHMSKGYKRHTAQSIALEEPALKKEIDWALTNKEKQEEKEKKKKR